MAITAAMVKELRETTGAGMMDAKKALTEADGDFDKAVESYQKLVKDYPASKDREAALFNASTLLEGQQRYAEAEVFFG